MVSRRQKIQRMLESMYQHFIVDATPSQRASLSRSLAKLTDTKGSWILYKARPLLEAMLDMVKWRGPRGRKRK